MHRKLKVKGGKGKTETQMCFGHICDLKKTKKHLTLQLTEVRKIYLSWKVCLPGFSNMAEGQSNGPGYPDILVNDITINDEVKYNILTKQWTDVHIFKFPDRQVICL